MRSKSDIFDRYFTEDEERLLLTFIKKVDCWQAKRDYWWMVLLRQSAMREGNLMSITVGDAKSFVQQGRVEITRLKKRKHLNYSFHANKKVLESLRALLTIHKNNVDNARWPGLAPSDRPLVISRNQRGMSARSMQTRMATWCEQAGLSFSATPHWWRHTWAKRRLEADPDMQTLLKIQAHLGHEDLSTTAIYLRPDKESMRDFLDCTH